MEIDHDRRVVYSETLALAGHDQEVLLARAAMAEVLAGAEAQTVLCRLREKTGLPYGSGYYDRKTSLTKEEGR